MISSRHEHLIIFQGVEDSLYVQRRDSPRERRFSGSFRIWSLLSEKWLLSRQLGF